MRWYTVVDPIEAYNSGPLINIGYWINFILFINILFAYQIKCQIISKLDVNYFFGIRPHNVCSGDIASLGN